MIRQPLFGFFDDLEFGLNSFDRSPFNDFFSSPIFTPIKKQNRKTKLEKRISLLKNQEQSLNRQIKNLETQVEQMKKSKEEIESHRTQLQQEIETIVEEKDTKTALENSTSQQKIFKKSYYKTPEIEIEEQYDSTDPKKCFKIIRKEGEAPQILNTSTQEALEGEKQKTPELTCNNCCNQTKGV